VATRPTHSNSISTRIRVPIRHCCFVQPCLTGAFSAGDTLVPIPNTKVKTRCGDDTPLGESSTVPDYSKTCLTAGFWRIIALMFTPWIKRKALKRSSSNKTLVVSGESPSRIMLLSLTALCMMVGIYVVQHSLADSVPANITTPAPMPYATPSMSPSSTPNAGVAPVGR
jgi:hypothetical protein